VALEVFKEADIEVNVIHTKSGYDIDLNKARILRQNNDLDSVYLVIGYEAKGNELFF